MRLHDNLVGCLYVERAAKCCIMKLLDSEDLDEF